MADDKEKGQRRVYIFPKELADRITKFQTSKGIPSEVEAVRRLLDEALKHRQDVSDIIYQFSQMLKNKTSLSDVVREVLVGHPKIAGIQFEANLVRFTTTDGEEVTVNSWGAGRLKRGADKAITFNEEGLLDEIPF